MKKYLSLLITFILISILLLSVSCEKQKDTKTYSITTYDLSQKDRLILNALLNTDAMKKFYSYKSEKELLKDIINHKFDLKYLDDNIRNSSIKKYYNASEIISYSDSDCRFVDKNTGMEKFISADYVQIKWKFINSLMANK